MAKKFQKGALSWAMYDWANSAFATTVMAGFFPIFFSGYFGKGLSKTDSTFYLGVTLSSAGILVALLAPVIGAVADKGKARKKILLFFAGIGILATACFAFIGEGRWAMAALCYFIALSCWLSGDSLYNSLIMHVSDEKDVHFLSGLGFSLGYLGGGILFALNVVMTLNPAMFGLVDKSIQDIAGQLEKNTLALEQLKGLAATLPEQFFSLKQTVAQAIVLDAPVKKLFTDMVAVAEVKAVKISFLTVAVWWLVFSLPLVFRVREKHSGDEISLIDAFGSGFKQFIETFNQIRKMKTLFLFLAAYWLYIDGVDTIISMAVDFGKTIGFETADLITALLMVQFVGFPFALLYGWLGQKLGAKSMILAAIVIYLFVTFFAYTIDAQPITILGITVKKFFVLAFLIGIVQGGIQSLSRSLYSGMVPEDKSASFFGFYNMMGKFATIIGPILIGFVGKATGNPRLGFLSISILFIVGGLLLLKVNVEEGKRQAQQT